MFEAWPIFELEVRIIISDHNIQRGLAFTLGAGDNFKTLFAVLDEGSDF